MVSGTGGYRIFMQKILTGRSGLGLGGLLIFALSLGQAAGKNPREEAIGIVTQIQRADYEGDRAALKRLYQELAPFAENQEIGAKVQYWRGFALWRRAINGGNEKVSPQEMEADFKTAASEFEHAMTKEPSFTDAKSAAGASLGNLMALYARNPDLAPELKDPARKQEAIDKSLAYMNEAQSSDPENPRVWWVLGPVRWYQSKLRGETGDQASDASSEIYRKGLELAQRRKSAAPDPLTPSWGEPECLMSLAAANFYRPTPDLAAAEKYARSALQLVPNWHFVKDILIPAIEAKEKEKQPVSADKKS